MRKKLIGILCILALVMPFAEGIVSYDMPAAACSENIEFEDDRVLVSLKSSGGISLFSDNSIFEGLGIAEIKNLDVHTYSTVSLMAEDKASKMLMLTLEEPGEDNVLEVVEKLDAMEQVEFAQPDYIYRLCTDVNDYYYNAGEQYSMGIVNATEVWEMDIDCSDVTVAIIDTGLKMTHEDLAGNLWINPAEIAGNGIDDDGNGYIDDVNGWDFYNSDNYPDDDQGHGSHVAGIVGAVTNNGVGVASVARNVKLVPVKIYDSAGKTTSSALYSSLSYVNDMSFDIINMSLGGISYDRMMEEGIKKCSGSLFVTAAGNVDENAAPEPDNDKVPIYPASYDYSHIIAVASTDSSDNLSSTSHYGVESVDIAAPGVNIRSTYYRNNSSYKTMGGTSMASPLVASAAAVIKARNPELTPEELIDAVLDGADVIDSLTGKISGGRRLNVYQSLMLLEATIEPTIEPTIVPTIEPTVVPTVEPVEDFTVELADGDDGISYVIENIKYNSGNIIIALYNSGMLVGMKVEPLDGSSDDLSGNIGYTSGPDAVKIMLWNDFKTIKPMRRVEIRQGSEWK